MDSYSSSSCKSPARFTLGKQSSLAPDREGSAGGAMRVRLMYMANEGDLEGIKELLDSGTNVNFKDIDGRTALHVAACQGLTDVVQLLLDRGADVDIADRWGSTVILFFFSFLNYLFMYFATCKRITINKN